MIPVSFPSLVSPQAGMFSPGRFLLLHFVLPQKGDGGGTGFEMHLGFLMGEVGQEKAIMTVLCRSLALFLPNCLFASIISLSAPCLYRIMKNKIGNRPNC